MTIVSEIKLIRTDTTLDLSQKAEKVCSSTMSTLIYRCEKKFSQPVWQKIILEPYITKSLLPNFQTHCYQISSKKKGPTGIWTRIAGFKVQSDNHYTIGPRMVQAPTLVGSEHLDCIFYHPVGLTFGTCQRLRTKVKLECTWRSLTYWSTEQPS